MLPNVKFQTCVNFTKSETCYHLHFCHAGLNMLIDELAIAQCSSFVKHHEWIPAMYFVVMFECCSIIIDAFRWLLADYRRPVPYLFCLPFPNCASDSDDLYIDFNRNQLPFPVALLDFHVEDRVNHSCANHAYASHTASRISYHLCIMLLEHCTWLIVFLLLVCLVWGSLLLFWFRSRTLIVSGCCNALFM